MYEKAYLIIAIILNLLLFGFEASIFLKTPKKANILKYYTFLSNFIAMIVSILFVLYASLILVKGGDFPIWVKGLRLSATFGLTTTLVIFAFILMPLYKKRDTTGQAVLFVGLNPRYANLLLHYLCPIISLLSFVFFERSPVLWDSEWTLYAALPTIFYWILYITLTATHSWEEPYGLVKSREQCPPKNLRGVLLLLLIPTLSVGLDYLLWWINTLSF